MRIDIIGIDMKVTDQVKEKIEGKLAKYHRFFGNDASCNVKMRPEKERVRVEITLKIQKQVYRSEVVAADVLRAMDEATDIMEGQIRKHKSLIKKRKQQYAYLKDFLDEAPGIKVEEEKLPEISRRKVFTLEAMDEEEAVLQMEMMHHDFHLFVNGNTGKVCLLYKRKEGDYGLIEPEY